MAGEVDEGTLNDQQIAEQAQKEELASHADEGGNEPETPKFDPSKVDVTDPDALGSLTDEQVSQVEKYHSEHSAPKTESDKDTSGKDTAEQAAADAAEKAQANATKYAGKYPTTDALAQGVAEIVKKLGLSADAFQTLLDVAKETGEYKSVEALYKKLERQLSEKGATTATPEKPATDPTTGTQNADTFNPSDPAVVEAVEQLTLRQLKSSSVADLFREEGLTLPTNMEEFKELAKINPYLAMEFKQAYRDLSRQNFEDAKGYFDAAKSVNTANTAVVDTDTKAIQALATEQGFKVTDAEIALVKEKALANQFNYETRHGHKFLRPNAVRDQFLVEMLPGKIKEIALAKQSEGRTQAVSDLDRAQKREVKGLSANKITSRTRNAGKKIPDLTDPDVIAALPDAALENPEQWFLKQGFTK